MSSRSGTRSYLSSPSLLATALAAVWSTWNILDGALLTFAPKDDPYDVVAYLVEAIGVVRISHGLQLFLSVVVGVPPKTSMGVAILPRLLFLITGLVMSTYEQLEFQPTASRMVLVSTGGLSVTAATLLSDRGRPTLFANLFSMMTFVKGCGMMFNPEGIANALFRIDASSLGKVPAKVRSLGFHLIISSIFMNDLTHGIRPMRAAGYSATAWSILLAYLIFVVGGHRGLSDVPGTYLFFLAGALSRSFVFLFGKPCKRLRKMLASLRRRRLRHRQGKSPINISDKEKMDKVKKQINTIASSVGASMLATIGAKLGSKLDERLVSATNEPILSILPTCSTIGTAIGASLGPVIGIKVADFIFTRLK